MTSLDTIRWRIILGLSGLLAGLVVAAIVGVTALGTLRQSLALEIEHLRASSEIGNGLVMAVFDEIRAAEQARAEFPSAADAAFSYQKRLDALTKKGFKIESWEALKRVPPGFPPDHPRADLLKRKGVGISFPKIPKEVRFSPKLRDWLAARSAETAPLIGWIEEHLS